MADCSNVDCGLARNDFRAQRRQFADVQGLHGMSARSSGRTGGRPNPTARSWTARPRCSAPCVDDVKSFVVLTPTPSDRSAPASGARSPVAVTTSSANRTPFSVMVGARRTHTHRSGPDDARPRTPPRGSRRPVPVQRQHRHHHQPVIPVLAPLPACRRGSLPLLRSAAHSFHICLYY